MQINRLLLNERYEIHSLLGEGGFGTTYQGIDILTHQQIAIKTISFQHIQEWNALHFFEREITVLKRLNHPNIPKYIDSFSIDSETDRVFYLVRELAIGESLSQLSKRGWWSTEEEIRQIIAQILEILVYLHRLNPSIIHRDIKPSNIIYQPDTGSLSLIDFGSVQDVFGHGVGTFVGTYGYIAPEQLRGETSPLSDIYSVGMTLAFLLTQREPSELPYKRMKIDLRSHQVKASNELLQWLEKATEPIPEDRFSSAKDALQGLRTGITKKRKIPKGSKIKLTKQNDSLRIELPVTLECLSSLLKNNHSLTFSGNNYHAQNRWLIYLHRIIFTILPNSIKFFSLPLSVVVFLILFLFGFLVIISVSFFPSALFVSSGLFVLFALAFLGGICLFIPLALEFGKFSTRVFKYLISFKPNLVTTWVILEFCQDKFTVHSHISRIPIKSFLHLRLPIQAIKTTLIGNTYDDTQVNFMFWEIEKQSYRKLISLDSSNLSSVELRWIHTQIKEHINTKTEDKLVIDLERILDKLSDFE